MRFREINEVSHVDLYPAQFEQFRAKWLPFASPTGTFYVNFTDHVGNTLDRSFSPKPNHRDPAGLYAYPLDYVLNHPADIEYGQQARFLRVVRDTSAHKLVLQALTMDEALRYLAAMGVDEPDKKMAHMRRTLSGRGGAPVATAFFGVVQNYTESGQKRTHTNAVQSQLLLRAGIDALEDRSTGKHTAVIYEDEPEQIVFLRRSAFKVVDVFELRSGRSANVAVANPAEKLRRLPALIASTIGDRIVNSHSDGALDQEQTYYTAQNRKIVVALSKEYSFDRGHREGTTSSNHAVTVRLLGPDFAPIIDTYGKYASYAEIAADVGSRFEARAPLEGKVHSRHGDYGPAADQTVRLYAAMAAKLKLPFDAPAPGSNMAYLVYAATRAVENPAGHLRAKTKAEQNGLLLSRFWSRFRQVPPQCEQMISIWAKAVKRLGTRLTSENATLEAMASVLGIKADTPPASPEPADDAAGFRIEISGRDIMAGADGTLTRIAQQENNTTAWDKPGGEDTTRFLPYASELAAFLNRNGMAVSGYAVFLARYYGIQYDGTTWRTLEAAAGHTELANGITLWKLPSGNGVSLCARYSGQTDRTGLDFGRSDKPLVWTLMEPLLSIDQTGGVSHISDAYGKYLRFHRDGKPRWNATKYHGAGMDNDEVADDGGSPQDKLFRALDASGFDIKKYMAENNLGFSRNFTGEPAALGLVRNDLNGRMAPAVQDTLDEKGRFENVAIAAFKDQFSSSTDYYVTEGTGWKIAFVTGSSGGRTAGLALKVLKMSPSLSPSQRAAVRAFLDKDGAPMPRKFAPYLAVAKPKKGSADARSAG